MYMGRTEAPRLGAVASLAAAALPIDDGVPVETFEPPHAAAAAPTAVIPTAHRASPRRLSTT